MPREDEANQEQESRLDRFISAASSVAQSVQNRFKFDTFNEVLEAYDNNVASNLNTEQKNKATEWARLANVAFDAKKDFGAGSQQFADAQAALNKRIKEDMEEAKANGILSFNKQAKVLKIKWITLMQKMIQKKN